jgi:DNA-binding MarR family transcriptional regulator
MPTRISRPERILELRVADNKQEAKERIMQFIQKKPGSRTSQIIEGLGIDPIQATQILDELKQENRVMSREIGQ